MTLVEGRIVSLTMGHFWMLTRGQDFVGQKRVDDITRVVLVAATVGRRVHLGIGH